MSEHLKKPIGRNAVVWFVVAITASSLLLWMTCRSYQRHDYLVRSVLECGGQIEFSSGNSMPSGPVWIRNVLGEYALSVPVRVAFYHTPSIRIEEGLLSASGLASVRWLGFESLTAEKWNPEILDSMPQLEVLLITDRSFRQDAWNHIAQMPALIQLEISGSNEHRIKLSQPKSPKLQILALTDIAAQGNDFRWLSRCAGVRTLDLRGTSLDDSVVNEIARMPSLRRVKLWRTSLSAAAIDMLRSSRPELEVEAPDEP